MNNILNVTFSKCWKKTFCIKYLVYKTVKYTFIITETFKINITVPGRTDYTVGQTVTVKKFKASPTKKEDATEDLVDNVISGKYLVAAINHVINRQNHECHMELIKDSLTMNLDKGAKK